MIKKYHNILLLILTLALCSNISLFSYLAVFKFNTEVVNDNPSNLYDLRLSGSQINITTPENTTYTNPMSGYYPATYGFEDEIDGTSGLDIDFVDYVLLPSGSSIDITSSHSTHKKVLNCTSGDPGVVTKAENYFPSSHQSGTIEFWVNHETFHQNIYVRVDDGTTHGVTIRFEGASLSMIQYFSGTWHNIVSYSANTWYHIQIDFECGSGGYNGLSADTFYLYINSTQYGPYGFESAATSMDRFMFHLYQSANKWSAYLDAVGYSWEPDYDIGDNLYEGLLLSFNNSTNLDWMGYSLDSQANKTILGNTTFPYPSLNGIHTIQVFGNNSIGTMYESDIRYFTINTSYYLNIITPENTTYTEPMNGYYPATYGFESDKDGTLPSYLVKVDDYPISVVSSRSGHNKVLWFDDNGYSYRASCYNNFSLNVDNGTIELWFLIDDAYDRTGLITRQGNTALVQFSSRYDKWKYHTSTQIDLNMQRATGGDMPSPLDNTWHQIRIDFECTTGKYSGLDQYTWKCWIDGIESAEMPFQNNATFADNFYMSTSTAHTSYNMYIDAIGYSWDPYYNIGDNLDEGLLFSYNTSFIPDWQGYSLDGQTNRTIMGNKTIPFPSLDGIHTIQVFGNDSIGTMYESDIRYFTIRFIEIITPKNTTYTEPMNGYYPATYGFENDRVGDDPNEWIVDENQGTVQVVSEIDNHKNIVELHDTDPSSGDGVQLNQTLNNLISGTIELWFRTSDASKDCYINIMDGTTHSNEVALYIYSGAWQYYDTSFHTIISASSNRWYHIRIEFDCASNWHLWIDGDQKDSGGYSFKGSPVSMDRIVIRTRGTDSGYYLYVDSIGYSWDLNYNIGDNLNGGLFLSFDTGFTPDWIGYSLDNQLNKTILGNTTFPFPSLDGIHTIQVFGNNTMGSIYESDIRYFTTNTSYYLNIITPENTTYTEPMSGYYPATYGFENDIDGTLPSYLVKVDDYPISVVSSRSGHNKVLWFDDNGYSYRASCYNNFSIKVNNGIVEYWFLVDDAYDRTGFAIRQGTSALVNMGSRYDLWRYHTVTQTDLIIQKATGGNMPAPLDNTWHHIRIAFECTTGNYLGLDQYTWKCWIDGVESAEMPFQSDESYSNNFYMSTSTAHTSYNMYIDAIGYSWDPFYSIGENLHEGLLFSFDTSFTPEWIGYSLDNQLNKTILGNITFPYPSLNGVHTIQVFGNNSIGTIYESDIRYFTINTSYYLNIITPENTTYTEPMSGYYPATYGFEDSGNGENPQGWTVVDIGGQVSIEANIGGHNKVVDIYKTSAGSGISCGFSQDINNQSSGTIEFWWRVTSTTKKTHFMVFENSIRLITLSLYDNSMLRYNDQGNWYYGFTYSADTWYLVSVDINMSTDTYSFSIFDDRGNLKQSGTDFTFEAGVTGDNFNRIDFNSGNFVSGYHHYVDAVGYSWDPNYEIGDNENEGLLLSFDTSFDPEWIGYSLDDQLNKTILGNTTFPYPSLNGIHTIQVFGNITMGTMYESDITYFKINTSYYLNIVTPENTTYTEPMRGYYPATFGFENDPNGYYPQDWAITGESGGNIAQIISDSHNHNKVLEFYDASGTTKLEASYSCGAQPNGTIELWMKTSNANTGVIKVALRTSINNFALMIGSNKFQYGDSSWHDVGTTAQSNTWYHIRIDYETTTGNYRGLSQWAWRVYINDIQYGDYGFQLEEIPTQIILISDESSSGYYGYFDAVGYSWDPNYNIGDNRYKGLQISFEKTPNFEWIGYSLDGNKNITITGNTTIPMLDNGLHSIQLFGNYSLGYFYESDIRYFTLNIPIAPPQISIYFPQAGDFYGYNAPYFEVSITSLYLDTKWYTLDNGMTKITFEDLSGTINQLEWENYGHGPITIKFYANDTFGQENYAKVTINKDLSPPNTTLLFTPYSGLNVVTDLTVFYLIADDHFESGVSIIRYRINNSSWITYSGAFRLSGFSPGDYLITYQAFDLVGNIESEQTKVVNLYNTPDRISEFSVLLTLSIILVASIGIAISIFAASILHDRKKSRIFVDEKKKRIDKITKDF